MKKITVTCLCFVLFLLCIQANTIAAVSSHTTSTEQLHPPVESTDTTLRENAYRSGRGTYSGGTRGGITRSPAATPGTGYTTGPRNPSNRVTNPSYGNPRGGGFGLGGLFGGFAAGTLLGSLLNPFGFGGGYGYGGGVSILGLLFWGVILYFIFRLFRRMRGQRR